MKHRTITTTEEEAFKQAWGWLVGEGATVLGITKFGDVFYKSPKGIEFLDTGIGETTQIAENMEAFEKALETSDGEAWFLDTLANEAESHSRELLKNECFSFITPPIMGGEYGVENIAILPIAEHLRVSADIQQQVKGLAEGTPVRLSVAE